ncbi:MAG: DMT family transporter [Rhodobacter sp.]|nr:DMT family transporter [Rhodobacter sp.]MCY4169458.1 DMT family transporter [Rhodobacter sp.]
MSDVHPLRAAIWMLGAIVSFTAMAVAARELKGQHDTYEIMTYRSLIGIVIVLAVGGWAGTLGQITGRSLHIHALRNICHFTGQNLWFFAIVTAPLAQVFALEFTTPIWAMLLATFLLGERLTRIRVLSAIIGFAGVLIVVRPDTELTMSAGLLAAGGAAVGFAFTAVFTRMLTRTETITCILFHLTVIQAILGLASAGFDGRIALPTNESILWLVLVGCSGLLAHFCMTKALSMASAAIVMPIDFARLPVIAVIGMAFYAEPLEWTVMVGACLIFLGNYTNIRAEIRTAA